MRSSPEMVRVGSESTCLHCCPNRCHQRLPDTNPKVHAKSDNVNADIKIIIKFHMFCAVLHWNVYRILTGLHLLGWWYCRLEEITACIYFPIPIFIFLCIYRYSPRELKDGIRWWEWSGIWDIFRWDSVTHWSVSPLQDTSTHIHGGKIFLLLCIWGMVLVISG